VLRHARFATSLMPIPPKARRPRVRSSRLATGVALATLSAVANAAPRADVAALEFSEGFLIGGGALQRGAVLPADTLPPGVHALDVQINNEFVRTLDVVFNAPDAGDPRLGVACVPRELLDALELRPLPRAALDAQSGSCMDLPAAIDGASVAVDVGALALRISVPQAAQAQSARGLVPRGERDDGITAVFVDYQLTHTRLRGTHNGYLGFTSGINAGAWRLRHRAGLAGGLRGGHYNRIGTTLQRDLAALDSRLLIGETHTGGQLFQSVAYRGIRLASDERMLPDSLRGYAPRVQGVADTNAVVTVRQNGQVIHQVNVAPGPFLIEDLYPTSSGGDLEVTVTEADGRERVSHLNFSAVPQALRAGAFRYAAIAGALQDRGEQQRPLRFVEATYACGINDFLTVLGGQQLAEGYRAGLAGVALNTAAGAFGADMTRSHAQLAAGRRASGNSLRFNYQRYFTATASSIGLAAYRYSSRDFLTLGQAAHAARDGWSHGSQARQRYDVNLSQRLGARSSLSLTAGHVAYWNAQRRRNDMQLSWQSTVGLASYAFSATRYRLSSGELDTRYGLNATIPLARSGRAPRLHTQLSRAAHGHQAQVGLNGSLGDDAALSYSVSANDAPAGGGTGYNGWLGYQGGRLNATAGYSHAQGSATTNVGVSGSMVIHGGGLTFGQSLGEGAVLVEADGAQGARVGSGRDIRIGRGGHALLPHISAYRWNRIELDPAGLPLDVEVLQSSRRVAPTAGSIVRVRFPVRSERILFIEATDEGGAPLPFAAGVQDETGTPRGAVGQGSVIQLRGAQASGVLDIDAGGPAHCRLQYHMPEAADAQGLFWHTSLCIPLPSRGLRAGPHEEGDAPTTSEAPRGAPPL